MTSEHGASLHFGNLLFLEATDRMAVRSNVAECRIDRTVATDVQAASEIAINPRRAGPIIAVRNDVE